VYRWFQIVMVVVFLALFAIFLAKVWPSGT
jgi:hypothetical protein